MKKISTLHSLKKIILGLLFATHIPSSHLSALTESKPITKTMHNPEAFVRELLSEAVSTLNEKNLSKVEKEKKFVALFRDRFHLKSIAGSTLRRGEVKTISPKKLERFLKLFEAMIFRVYMKQIEQLSLEGFKVSSIADQEEGGKLIKTIIERRDNPTPFEVNWILYTLDGTLKIFDVVVDRISMGQIQRQKIQDIRQGGNFDLLLTQMENEYAADVIP